MPMLQSTEPSGPGFSGGHFLPMPDSAADFQPRHPLEHLGFRERRRLTRISLLRTPHLFATGDEPRANAHRNSQFSIRRKVPIGPGQGLATPMPTLSALLACHFEEMPAARDRGAAGEEIPFHVRATHRTS